MKQPGSFSADDHGSLIELEQARELFFLSRFQPGGLTFPVQVFDAGGHLFRNPEPYRTPKSLVIEDLQAFYSLQEVGAELWGGDRCCHGIHDLGFHTAVSFERPLFDPLVHRIGKLDGDLAGSDDHGEMILCSRLDA